MAGERAAEFVSGGMNIGLGTGSTVYWTIRRLGLLVEKGLNVRAVPTSKATEDLAKQLKIPLISFMDVQELDLTIDGADEISPALDLIKGGGGALLREKLVAAASKKLIIVAGENKLVPTLGAALLPVEIVPFGWKTTARRVEKLDVSVKLRMTGDKAFVTDNGNYILDCACGKILDPNELHNEIKSLTGVVETGIFAGMADAAVIAGKNGTDIIEKKS